MTKMKRHLIAILFALCLAVGFALWQSNQFAQSAAAKMMAPLATITVNSVADGALANNGQCTLREAILNANGANQSGSTDCVAGTAAGNTIVFNLPAGSDTIILTAALPDITRSLTITGPGAKLLTTVRNPASSAFRIFHIPNPGLNIAISGLTIRGGALANEEGAGIKSLSNLTLTNCAIVGNNAFRHGGVYLSGDGVFTGCTFNGNSSPNDGGAISFFGSTLRLSNCTITNNSSRSSLNNGGILAAGATVEVVNCTLADNNGLSVIGGTTRLRNTLLFNTSLVVNGGSLISLGNNLTNDNGSGLLSQPTDKINTNPLLGPLADNGGPTQTHVLLVGSPALNAGANCVTTNNCASNNLGFNLTTDQRGAGFPRLGGSAVDIGAFEGRSGVPSYLSFGVQPTGTTPNAIIAPAVTVRVMDEAGDVVTASTATISLALGANPGGATLGGTLSRAAVAGVATFNNLTVNQAGAGYTLTASSNGLTGATSNAFNICPTMTVTPGTNPSVVGGALSANLPYTATGNPNRYSIDYNAAANAVGFADVTNAVLPTSPIVLTIPGTAPTGTYNATLTLSASATNCPSNTAPFTVTLLPCLTTTFTVNSLGDTPDANPGNQVCADGAGNCTLRAALMEANALGICAVLTINFSVTGTINLTGALPDIISSLTITGPGAKLLTVRRNTNSEYRIFTIPNGGLNIVMRGLTITNGVQNGVGGSIGGGIFSSSPLTLTDCVIAGNQALFGGGVVLGADGVFTGCTFSGNTSFNTAGGISFGGGTLRLSNCTINDNFGSRGGGGILTTGVLEAINCTITSNRHVSSAPGSVSGILVSGGIARLRNTIVANNQSVNLGVNGGSLTSLGNNLTSDNGGGLLNQPTDKINTDPLLGPLADNGGQTPTQALLVGSPAINVGANCVTTNNCASNNLGFNLTTDQRGAGFVRLFGGTVDMGAYENQCSTTGAVGGGGTICATQAANVTVSVSGGAAPYTVTLTNGGGTQTGNGPTFTFPVTPGATTSYQVAAGSKDANNCPITNSGTVTVTVSQLPTAANAGPDQTVCGTSTTLAANAPTVGTGAWTIVSGAGGSVTTPSSRTSAFTGVAGTSYTLRWTISNAPCAASTDDVVITLRANPTTANAGPDQTVCGTSTTLAANAPTVGTGAWTIVSGAGGSVTTPSSRTSAFTGVAGTSYTLRWTISNAPCAASTDDIVITLRANPTTANAGPDQTVCGTSTTLAANAATVGAGAWTIISGAGGTVTTASNPASAFTGVAGTNYTLRWTISNAPCTASTDTVVINFNRQPTLTYAAAGVSQGASTTINPLTGPSDDGTITNIAVQNVTPAFGGTIAVNNSGQVSVGNASPPGSYSVIIRATDNCGSTTDASFTLTVTNGGLQFYPLAHPVRLLDTRIGQPGCDAPAARIPGNTSRHQTAAGRTCDGLTIPANAAALVGNATSVQSGGGYFTLYPSDIAKPDSANSNFAANQILNSLFTVRLGASDGAFKIFVSSDTDIVVDITGYYAPPSASGLYFHPLPKPVRLLDTRQGASACFTPGAALQGDSTTSQIGTTTCDGVLIPAGAQALTGNATTVSPQANGFLTLYPTDAARPLIASANFQPGVNLNSPFMVGLSLSGQFNMYVASTTDLVVDVTGYYSTQLNDSNGQGLLFNALAGPSRLLDTQAGQTGCFTPNAPMTGGASYTQTATGACTNVPASAQAVVGNATVMNATANGYLTFWPSDANQPFIATSNYRTGITFNRHFTVGLGNDGAFKRYAASTTDLVMDLVGYFAP